MTQPSVPATHVDLFDRPTAMLSTVGADGYPQVTALWLVLDEDGVLRTSLMRVRQKYKNMLAHTQATIFVIDPRNPFRTIEVRADVTFVDDPDAEFFERIVGHYGQDPATFPAPREDRVVLELHPYRIVTNG